MEAVQSVNRKITCESLLQQLQQIWDEVGETDEERDKMVLQLEQECLDVYRRKFDKAVNSRAHLLRTLADAKVELSNLHSALGLNTYVGIPEDTSRTIKEQLAAIAPALDKLLKQKNERIKEFSNVEYQIHKICTEIDEQVECPGVDESDLSTKKLDKLHAQLRELQKEKSGRLHKVLEFVNSVRDLCAVLGTDFFTTVTEVHPSLYDSRGVQSISISNATLSRLEKTVLALKEDKKKRLQKLQELAAQLIDLWNWTETPLQNRNLFDRVTCNISALVDEVIVPGALSIDLIEEAKVEIERLDQLKAATMKEISIKRHAELEEIFSQADIERENVMSPIGSVNDEPADLFADVDNLIVEAKEGAAIRKDILDKVEKWMSASEEESWVEDNSRTDMSNECNSVPDNGLVMDYSSEFTNHDIFDNREDLVAWARQVGKRHGMVMTTKASNNGNGRRRRPYVILVCERAGNYRKSDVSDNNNNINNNTNAEVKKRKRSSGTKKCGCPFELKGTKLGKNEDQVGWELAVVCGTHNHSNFEKKTKGHSYAGRLSADEITLVEDMFKRSFKPRDILAALKQRDETNATSLKTLYNTRHMMRLKEKAERSQMKLLMGKLDEKNYTVRHRLCEKTNEVIDMLWMHDASVGLLRNFPHVLIMDCTYRTNCCRFPLLEIMGITPTNMMFTVAFAYLELDKAENYEWALGNLQIIMEGCVKPSAVVTDRNLELMKAIEVIYPDSRHMLCRWHISNNIMDSCKKLLEGKGKWGLFELEWGLLVEQETEELFNIKLSSIQNQFSDYPFVLSYIQETWLDPYKDRFVSAWTDTCKNFGVYTTTSNRAESAHAKLKRHLESSQGAFFDNWDETNKWLLLQQTEIEASFTKSRNHYQRDYMAAVFKELRGFVSLFALEKINAELKRSREMPCTCSVRATHGLPCAHELYDFQIKGIPIPLSCVDPHWRVLSVESNNRCDSGENIAGIYDNDMQEIRNILDGVDNEQRRVLMSKMRKIVMSDANYLR